MGLLRKQQILDNNEIINNDSFPTPPPQLQILPPSPSPIFPIPSIFVAFNSLSSSSSASNSTFLPSDEVSKLVMPSNDVAALNFDGINGGIRSPFLCPLGIQASIWPSCLSLSEAFVNVAFTLVVMLVIVLGNLMVVLTVKFDSKLRAQRQNWLIVSLAVADLLVGLLVMPLTLLYEIIGVWVLGSVLCELWLALDVLFVTASILHICIISLDRYWSVTQPLTYPIKRTPTRICIMIGVAWLVSFLICFPPLLGWRPKRSPGECSVSQELDYVVYSSLGSFYMPVAVLVMVYWRIYEITKQHSQQRLKDTQRMDQTLLQMTNGGAGGAKMTTALLPHQADGAATPLRETAMMEAGEKRSLNGNGGQHKELENCNSLDSSTTTTTAAPNRNNRALFRSMLLFQKTCSDSESMIHRKRSMERRKRRLKAKERQATLLLGLILFAFIASWMPFFIMYVLNALTFETPEPIFKFFFWLGYCNSAINPIIYTYYNREFKRALFRLVRRHQHHLLFFQQLVF